MEDLLSVSIPMLGGFFPRNIPESWSIKKISDIADLNKGVSYTSKEIGTEEEGVALINLGNF